MLARAGGKRSRRSIYAADLLAALTAVLFAAEPALAHGNIAVGEFYAGALQPLLHLESLLPLLVLAIWSVQAREPGLWQIPTACLTASAAGAVVALLGVAVSGASHLGGWAMLLLGLLVAIDLRLPLPMAAAIGGTVGLMHGYTGTFAEEAAARRPLLYLCGLLIGTGLFLFHVENILYRARAFWMKVGLRVVGSWIAAVGLLRSVLSLLDTTIT